MSIEIANFTEGQKEHSEDFHRLSEELKAKYPNVMITIIHDEGYVEAFLGGHPTEHVTNPFFEMCKATTTSLIIEHCRIMGIEVPSPYGEEWNRFVSQHLTGLFLMLIEDHNPYIAELIQQAIGSKKH